MRRLPAHGVEVDGVSLDTYLADLKARIVALEAGGAIPQAAFTMNPTSGAAPLTVSFTDTSTGAPDTWAWDFGDGATSTVQNPSHEYTTQGDYTINLTASNAYGSTATTRSVTVDAAPVVTTYSGEVMADAPLGYWRLGEASGTTMVDASGNARNGVYSGAVVLGKPALLAASSDTAADFAYPNPKGRVPFDSAWMRPSAYTAEVIIKPDAVTGDPRTLMARHATSGATGGAAWDIQLVNGKVVARTYTPAQGWKALTGATTLTVGSVYHVAVTFDGTTLRTYLNGSPDGSLAVATPEPTSTAALTVGSLDGNTEQPFDGIMDEAAFYGTALSAARIAAHHTAAVTAA